MQWWSIEKQHLSQLLQWCVLAGLILLHLLHFLCQKSSRSLKVFDLYLISFFISLLTPYILWSGISLRFFCFLTYCLSCSIVFRSFGLPGLIIIAMKWLKQTLYTKTRPITPQISPRGVPVLDLRYGAMCSIYSWKWNAIRVYNVMKKAGETILTMHA